MILLKLNIIFFACLVNNINDNNEIEYRNFTTSSNFILHVLNKTSISLLLISKYQNY